MNEFITVIVLHLFAVMSPGPDYVLITRQSIRYGRRVALWSSGGIGVGILFHSFLAVTGILFLIASNEFYLLFLKSICSVYLLYLGITSIINTSEFNQNRGEDNKWNNANGFVAGMLTNITNVKALLFFITLFGVVLNGQTQGNLMFYGLYMAFATFIWFSLLSYIFTSDTFKAQFLTFFKFFEKFLGLILVIIAVQLIGNVFLF
jgi:threonine/homoserine/homoserine lactone efflux protein